MNNISHDALTNCDKEPIHIPETIQNVGFLFALDSQLDHIKFYSKNCEDIFPNIQEDDVSLTDLLDHDAIHELRNMLGHSTAATQREHVTTVSFHGISYDVSAHMRGENAIIEFLPSADTNPLFALDKVRWILEKTQHSNSVDALLNISVEHLRTLTKYDRVMAYRFHPDQSGEIIAEARAPYAESYLGLRYPAWDIPVQARELYLKTPIRFVADVQADTVPLISKDPAQERLDMSLAVLRGTSKVHLQYLQNMGVRSTMTLPIIVGGKLWGLFAFHHMEPVQPTQDISMASELAGRLLSLSIEKNLERHKATTFGNCLQIANNLIGIEDNELCSSEYWMQAYSDLMNLMPVNHVIYCVDDRIEDQNPTISKAVIHTLKDMAENNDNNILACDDLQALCPGEALGDVAGALVIPIISKHKNYLIFFRNAIAQSISWAGAPKKDLKETEDGTELTPRASFARFIQETKNKSESWTNDELLIAESLQKALQRAVQTKEYLKHNRHRLGLMVHELNHRVRNILALIRSLSNQAKESATSLEAYAESLEQRILALAGTHDMLVNENMEGVLLSKLAKRELKPYLQTEELDEAIQGLPITIHANIAPVIALVLHELTSNAVKHGALSLRKGKITITWRKEKGGLRLEWREYNGPTVKQPERKGFGRSLIELSFAYEFDGTAEIHFKDNGFEGNFWLPEDIFTTGKEESNNNPDDIVLPVIESPKEINGYALIVEDNFVLATDMATSLRRAGFKEVDMAATISQAMRLIDNRRYDFALLDMNLRGEMSFPVAEKLKKLGIDFVFATGYGDKPDIPSLFDDINIITKPLKLEDVLRNIR